MFTDSVIEGKKENRNNWTPREHPSFSFPSLNFSQMPPQGKEKVTRVKDMSLKMLSTDWKTMLCLECFKMWLQNTHEVLFCVWFLLQWEWAVTCSMISPTVEILWKHTCHLTSCLSLNYRRMPSLLEYLSYNCNFMGILAGPLCSYKDYINFIEGRSYQLQQSEANGKEDTKYEQTDPSPNVRCMTLAVPMLM